MNICSCILYTDLLLITIAIHSILDILWIVYLNSESGVCSLSRSFSADLLCPT